MVLCDGGYVAGEFTATEVDYVEYVPVAKRRAIASEQFLHRKKLDRSESASPKPSSLLVRASQLRRDQPEVTPAEQIQKQEQELIEHLPVSKALTCVRESANGITYTEPLLTGWKPPSRVRRMKKKDRESILNRNHIAVACGDGDSDIPPPIENFTDLGFPEPILEKLREKGIAQPTPIQVQGLPVALSGRDMIGLSFTGSGKTLVFVFPLIMIALQEEMLMPVARGEGPVGLIICPHRDLARQTYDVVQEFLSPLRESGYPELRAMLCIGGASLRSQLDVLAKGVHIVVATPGRLKALLDSKNMNLDICRCLTLDEADALVKEGFEDDIHRVVSYFRFQRWKCRRSEPRRGSGSLAREAGCKNRLPPPMPPKDSTSRVSILQEQTRRGHRPRVPPHKRSRSRGDTRGQGPSRAGARHLGFQGREERRPGRYRHCIQRDGLHGRQARHSLRHAG